MTTDNSTDVPNEPAEAPAPPSVVPDSPSSSDVPPPPVEPNPVAEMGEDADLPEDSQDESPETAAADEPPAEGSNKEWYVVKVQSNREESIKAAIERRVKIEGLEDSFGQVVIPTEKVSEMRRGKRVIRERKLLHGYLLVNVEFNDRMLYLFRETSGVGDFVGAGIGKKPNPMSENEIKKWIGKEEGTVSPTEPKDVSPFNEGDKVKVKDGMFSGMEGVVKQVLQAKGAVVVELTIFGRPVPVELEYWQVDFI